MVITLIILFLLFAYHRTNLALMLGFSSRHVPLTFAWLDSCLIFFPFLYSETDTLSSPLQPRGSSPILKQGIFDDVITFHVSFVGVSGAFSCCFLGQLGAFYVDFFYFASLSQISFGCNFLKLFPFQMTLMDTDQEGCDQAGLSSNVCT
jgi:hypothetical protein